jgi:hypothetical protein
VILRVATGDVTVIEVLPVRSGTSKQSGQPWSMQNVKVLDTDYNKAEVTWPRDTPLPGTGEKLSLVMEVEVDYRLQASCRVIKVNPPSTAKQS